MKGRVSRQDLLIECNKIIKLDPSQRDLEKINEEESKLLQEVDKEFKVLEKEQEVKWWKNMYECYYVVVNICLKLFINIYGLWLVFSP